MVDIALLGATGFAGRLTAHYLARRLPVEAQWSIAGRNLSRLTAIADDIARAGGNRPELVVADVSDSESMRLLAEGTRVLISTVGPYLAHGEAAVRACAVAGTDYVDLTGEPEFVDRMWLRYHETAVASGARIVHACGFDSIPYDIGIYRLMQKLASETHPVEVRGYIRASGTFSAGTIHSAIGQISRMKQSARAAAMRRRQESRPQDRTIRGGGRLGRGPDRTGWALPLPTIDPQIVLRSARGLDLYGPQFGYEHYALFRRLPVLMASVCAAAIVGLAVQIGPLRRLILTVLPSGSGPSQKRRDKSWFVFHAVASSGTGEETVQVRGGDPGYTETATMLAESAMCLAFDALPPTSGQTTTAVAMGDKLMSRLVLAGIAID